MACFPAIPQLMLDNGALKLVPFVDVTPLFSLRENAIAKEPGLSYPERWRCVSRLGASMVAQTPWSLPRM